MASPTETIAFAGGCFWCTEAVFEQLRGVKSIVPGYTGGTTKNPTYDMVRSGKTGHAEAIKIEYDPAELSLEDLLTVFFYTHDPTTLNRQGADVGTQYRSAIFYSTPSQKIVSEQFIAKLDESGPKVVTELAPLGEFYAAEEYHRQYYRNNQSAPYCQVVINPKLRKLKDRFAELAKN